MKMNRVLLLVIALMLGFGVLLSCDSIPGRLSVPDNGESGFDKPAAFPATVYAQTAEQPSIADIAEKSVESVVNISSNRIVRAPGSNERSPFFDDPFFEYFFGPDFEFRQPRERREQSLGSGVIVSDDGIVLTNNHVVENADELTVTLHDGREFKAEIIGTDPETDLAVIKLSGDDIGNLEPISFGDSDILRLGDVVLAIGNPFGLGHTVTMGIISAKGRTFERQRIAEYEDFIQTDAAINPGNSGGALVNMRGELVGINTAIVSRTGGYQGIGFAIPVNMARVIMDELIEEGEISRGWLGVTIQDVTPDIAEAMNIEQGKGALVADVQNGGPADEAGLESGDVIISLDDNEIRSSNHLKNVVALIDPGTEVSVTAIRDGEKRQFRITLGERDKGMRVTQGDSGIFDGFSVAELTDAMRERYSIPDDIERGVVVTGVEQNSPADMANLVPGDVIIEVDDREVGNVKEFTAAYEGAGDHVLIYVIHRGSGRFTVLRKQ